MWPTASALEDCVAMSAPKYVPVSTVGAFRKGERLPSAQAWVADRPGEIDGGQPRSARLGSPGPNQGYALKLAHSFHGRLKLVAGEDEHDVVAGVVPIALKRASLYGRGPVIQDLERGFNLFGFLADAPVELVELRKPLFQAVGHSYERQRGIADLVPDSTLKASASEFGSAIRSGKWRSLLSL